MTKNALTAIRTLRELSAWTTLPIEGGIGRRERKLETRMRDDQRPGGL
jgi:hypothetical protein